MRYSSHFLAPPSEPQVFTLESSGDYPEVPLNSLTSVTNMLKLSELSEGSLLHNLRLRYAADDIYTYISTILLSVNPYKPLPVCSEARIPEWRDNTAVRLDRLLSGVGLHHPLFFDQHHRSTPSAVFPWDGCM
jgi:hypothetical protein